MPLAAKKIMNYMEKEKNPNFSCFFLLKCWHQIPDFKWSKTKPLISCVFEKISPSLTGSLFLVTFKALFPLLLVMGGCTPEMCLYGIRLEFELNVFKKDNQTFVLCAAVFFPLCQLWARDTAWSEHRGWGLACLLTYWLHCHVDYHTITLYLSFLL